MKGMNESGGDDVPPGWIATIETDIEI